MCSLLNNADLLEKLFLLLYTEIGCVFSALTKDNRDARRALEFHKLSWF